jgi:hypothetical protein
MPAFLTVASNCSLTFLRYLFFVRGIALPRSFFGNSGCGLSIVAGHTLPQDQFGIGCPMAKLFILYWSVIVDCLHSIFSGVIHLRKGYGYDHCGMVLFAKIAIGSFGK